MNDGDEYNHAGRFGAPEVYNFSSYPALYVFKDGEMLDPYFGGREVSAATHAPLLTIVREDIAPAARAPELAATLGSAGGGKAVGCPPCLPCRRCV